MRAFGYLLSIVAGVTATSAASSVFAGALRAETVSTNPTEAGASAAGVITAEYRRSSARSARSESAIRTIAGSQSGDVVTASVVREVTFSLRTVLFAVVQSSFVFGA